MQAHRRTDKYPHAHKCAEQCLILYTLYTSVYHKYSFSILHSQSQENGSYTTVIMVYTSCVQCITWHFCHTFKYAVSLQVPFKRCWNVMCCLVFLYPIDNWRCVIFWIPVDNWWCVIFWIPADNWWCVIFWIPADNWWCLVDGGVFSRLVDMYKSIVVFLLTGGKALLVPVFLENYTSATLKLLEKLHKVTFPANDHGETSLAHSLHKSFSRYFTS